MDGLERALTQLRQVSARIFKKNFFRKLKQVVYGVFGFGFTSSVRCVEGVLLVSSCCDSNKFRNFSVQKSAKVCFGALELILNSQTKIKERTRRPIKFCLKIFQMNISAFQFLLVKLNYLISQMFYKPPLCFELHKNFVMFPCFM